MIKSKHELTKVLLAAGIPYKGTSDTTHSIYNRMGDFIHCPFCDAKIFSHNSRFIDLIKESDRHFFKFVVLEPQINNNPHLAAVVISCKNCNETIWRHLVLSEI